jgi:hypothetical protein
MRRNISERIGTRRPGIKAFFAADEKHKKSEKRSETRRTVEKRASSTIKIT